jgi:hypothetical protein
VIPSLPPQQTENKDGHKTEDRTSYGQSNVEGDIGLHFCARRWNKQVNVKTT